MATIFMETPDATQAKEFWTTVVGAVTYDTGQKKSGLASWKADSGAGNAAAYLRKTAILADAGRRISVYFRFNAFPANVMSILTLFDSTEGLWSLEVQVNPSGVLSFEGVTGSTLSTGIWYRICLAYTITSSTISEFRVYLNGILDITKSNIANRTDSSAIRIGWRDSPGANKVLNFHHVYVDDSAALTDIGDIRVTAKLPNAVVHDDFDGSTGAVNERPISEANLQSHTDTTQVHQDYDIETAAGGDVDISADTQIALSFWVWAADGSGANGTPKLIYQADTEQAISLVATPSLFTKIVDTAIYPSAGTSVIGMESTGAGADTFFYEGGVLVAYKVAAPSPPAAEVSQRSIIFDNVVVKVPHKMVGY